MNGEKRRQVGVSPVIGILLLVTPLVSGLSLMGTTSFAAWVFGSIVGVAAVALAIFWLGASGNRVTEALTVLVGLALLVSPMLVGAAWLSAGAWAAYALGALLVLAAGGVFVKNAGQVGAPLYRRVPAQEMASAGRVSYRRVSSPM
jgi:hypothetical protein